MVAKLTVAELGTIISRPGADPNAVLERLKSWSDCGLLEVAGTLNPGRGIRRSYAVEMAYRAVVLDGLADLGFTVGQLRYFVIVLAVAERARTQWFKKRRSGLVIEICDFGVPDHQGGRHAVFLHDGKRRDHLGSVMHPRAETAILVNVSRLFMRIEEKMNLPDLPWKRR